jgi:hypothetical protein
LFNAIAKTKKEAAEKEAAEKSKEKSEGDEISFYSLIKKCSNKIMSFNSIVIYHML